MVLCKI